MFCNQIFPSRQCFPQKYHLKIKNLQKLNFLLQATRCITPKRVTSLRRSISASLRPGNTAFFQRNVVAVASRWQHCVRFDRPDIWTSDLSLQRRRRFRSTNWQGIGNVFVPFKESFWTISFRLFTAPKNIQFNNCFKILHFNTASSYSFN